MTFGTKKTAPPGPSPSDATRRRRIPFLLADERGAVLVEAAFVMPLIIAMLLGVVTYGLWFAEAHSLQQVANDAARSTLGTMNAAERQAQVDKTVDAGFNGGGLIKPANVVVTTALDGTYYTVTLSYDTEVDDLFANSLIPLPQKTIVRAATIQLATT